MEYVASQYSLIENLHLFAHLQYVESSEILRPDGSSLISFDAEHQWYPSILVDELNSLLVLPNNDTHSLYTIYCNLWLNSESYPSIGEPCSYEDWLIDYQPMVS